VRIAPDSDLGKALNRHVRLVQRSGATANKSQILRDLIAAGLNAQRPIAMSRPCGVAP
jgi:hypothetical protein